MHDAEWGMVVTAATVASGFFGAWLAHRARTKAAMLEAQTEIRGQDTTITVKHMDDTTAFRQELWARCEKLETRVGELVHELHAERQKYLELLRDHLNLQAQYEEAQREVGELKRDLQLAKYAREQ